MSHPVSEVQQLVNKQDQRTRPLNKSNNLLQSFLLCLGLLALVSAVSCTMDLKTVEPGWLKDQGFPWSLSSSNSQSPVHWSNCPTSNR